jgi:hypothetical protein
MYSLGRSTLYVHKTPIIPPRVYYVPSQGRPSGPGRWGRLNFVVTEFSEVRFKGILGSPHSPGPTPVSVPG